MLLLILFHSDNGDTAVEVLDIPSRTSTNDDETTGGIIEGHVTGSFSESTGGYDNLVIFIKKLSPLLYSVFL